MLMYASFHQIREKIFTFSKNERKLEKENEEGAIAAAVHISE